MDVALLDRLASPPRPETISAFCARWGIAELALFGSVLREDFGLCSDVDVLLTFTPGADPTPDREAVRQDLEAVFGRPVDVVYRRVIEGDPNYIIRRAILDSARVLYAA
jgi:uncharacterized protein